MSNVDDGRCPAGPSIWDRMFHPDIVEEKEAAVEAWRFTRAMVTIENRGTKLTEDELHQAIADRNKYYAEYHAEEARKAVERLNTSSSAKPDHSYGTGKPLPGTGMFGGYPGGPQSRGSSK